MEHTTTYVVIAVYLSLMVVVGLIMRRLNSDTSDYFRSGCKGTWWLVGASGFMGAFSAWTFSGAAGAAYESGWSVSIVYLANALGFTLNAILLAPWFRQMRAITVPQVIQERFGHVTQQFYAWISVVLGVCYAALFLYGLAIFIAAVFGFKITHVVLVVGSVVLLYSVAGGSWAVMSNDFLQALILVPITLLMAFLSLRAVGGWGGFMEHATETTLSQDFALFNDPARFAGQYTLLWAVAMLIKNVIGYNTITSSVRYFSVKDGREARKAAWLGAILMAVGAIVWMIPPMVGRMLYSGQVAGVAIPKPAESAYAIVSMQLLPKGLIGLMVVAMLAATMSSMDQGLNRNAAIFTRDIYPTICRLLGHKPAEGRKLLWWGQTFSFLFGILIILLTLYFVSREGEGVFEHMLTLGAVLVLPMTVPMLLAIFVRRAPWWAAIFAVLFAAVPSGFGLWLHWSFQIKVLVNVSAGVIGFMATVPFWRYESQQFKAKVETFFEQMNRPVDFAREVGAGNDLQQLVIIGRFSLATGVLISLLMLLPQTGFDRLCILFVGGFVAAVGALLMYAGRRKPQQTSELSPSTARALKTESGK